MSSKSRGKAPDPLFVLRTQRAEVTSLCFHSELDYLFSGGIDGSITQWNLTTRRTTGTLRAHNKTPLCSHPSVQSLFPSNIGLISQGRDGMIKLWDYSQFSNSLSEPINTIQTNCTTFTSCSSIQLSNSIQIHKQDSKTGPTMNTSNAEEKVEDSNYTSFLTQQLKEAKITEIQQDSSEIQEISINPLIAVPTENSEQVCLKSSTTQSCYSN